MVRRKKRYLLVYGDVITRDRCKAMGIYLIEKDEYAIVRCYLSDLEQVKDNLEKEGITIVSISGTLKALREKKSRLLCK